METKRLLLWDNYEKMSTVWTTNKHTTNTNAVKECSKYYNPYGYWVQEGRFEFIKICESLEVAK